MNILREIDVPAWRNLNRERMVFFLQHREEISGKTKMTIIKRPLSEVLIEFNSKSDAEKHALNKIFPLYESYEEEDEKALIGNASVKIMERCKRKPATRLVFHPDTEERASFYLEGVTILKLMEGSNIKCVMSENAPKDSLVLYYAGEHETDNPLYWSEGEGLIIHPNAEKYGVIIKLEKG